MAFTQGPWFAEYSQLDIPGWRVRSVERQPPPYDAYSAVFVNLAFSARETAEANANLIAQAPALVAALSALLAKIAIDRVEMECPVCNCHELPDIKCKAEVEQARSVLAAIRGATHA